MIPKLPIWNVTNLQFAFNDMESKTGIEMTARLYSKMQEIIDGCNEFINKINNTIESFTNDICNNQEEFETRMTKIIHDYIDYMDSKYAEQDKEIKDAIAYMKENLSSSITAVIAEMKEMGELDEAILNAVEGIGNRVVTLEESNTNLQTRVSTLENTNTYLSYNEDTKELNLIINERVGD